MVRRWTAATERRHPTNLTVPRDPLIGREGELDALRRLVRRADVGLVTLTGAGGIGKTRLALQAAADLLDDFPDGVHVVSLAAIRNPELVASAIGQALGVNETGDQPLMASLRALLHDRQLLLLLDNMEQVLESAPLVTSLLSSCPGLKVLATSRIVMHLSGEHEFPVPPLALPNLRELSNLQALSQSAAIALFVQRAQAIQRNFGLSAANAGIIAEICVRLDGLPLALELAAARLRVLTPADLLARLTNRLTILTGGPRDLPARQQTLRDTIDWSYDLLPSEEQRLFRRLAPFAGGFTFDAAKTLLRDPGDLADKSSRTASTDALEGISSLIDNSLAQPVASVDNEPRFAMLETIREYAIERLEESGEAGAIRRRHARYYLELVETTEPAFFNKEWPIWLRRLEQEHDNLRAALQSTLSADEAEPALRLAGTLAWFWYDRGHLSEGRRWLATVFAQAGTAPSVARAKALIGAGSLAHRQYDLDKAVEYLDEGLRLSRELGDDWSSALALINLGLVAHDQGDYVRARELHEESLALCRAAGNAWGIGISLSNLGWAALFLGDLGRARAVTEEALALRRELGDTLGLAYTLYTLSRVAFAEDREAECRVLLAESVDLFREVGERWGLAACLETLAIVNASSRRSQEDAIRAARLWGASHAVRETLGAPLTSADRRVHERYQEAARLHAGEERWNDALAEGKALPLDEVLRDAFDITGQRRPEHPRPPTSIPPHPAGLTTREIEVLRLVADGLTNAEVAARLSLSPRTIGQHLRSIYNKLNVGTRTAAARFAIEHELV